MFDVDVFDHATGQQHSFKFPALPRVGDGVKMKNRHGVTAHFTVREVWFEETSASGIFEPRVMVEED